ncbi:hypothetical protein CONLIGDRAFT_649934 [Coniochaeta ligniaria NRRL 30616]|uniref:MYND-type domain-containing protein n=1 Tax=Coniochaeta ligniaria NRRL 30616 TaxID=1408157 RepID=A0A1J7I6G1_9PEZI|nr:hypothetical protein CONLIGDRAFT_649934 [Coniochaeta ligniaria NRRL 30616]
MASATHSHIVERATCESAVATFFEHLPSPKDHHEKPLHELLPELEMAMRKFTQVIVAIPDITRCTQLCFVLMEVVALIRRNRNYVTLLYAQLARIAMSMNDNPSDNGPMARQLRYLRWVAKGMKDETSPFRQLGSVNLASAPVRCAACGAESNRRLHCSACLLPADTGVSYGTSYCNSGCQKRHWAVHRLKCRQIRSLKRASDTFDEVFRYALSVTHNPTYTVTLIKADDGALLAEFKGEYTTPSLETMVNGASLPEKRCFDSRRSDYRHNTSIMHAATKQLQRSTKDNSRTTSIQGKSLLLTQQNIGHCLLLESVTFIPKNMTLPVRLAYSKFNSFSALSHHDVIRATLRCGEQYAIDPTSLQFGWKHTITPWETYATQRIRHIDVVNVAHPQPAGTMLASATIQQRNSLLATIAATAPLAALVEIVVHGVNKMLRQQGGIDMQTVCAIKAEAEFVACRARIVGCFRRGIDQVVRERGMGGEPLLCLPKGRDCDDLGAVLRGMDVL